MEKCKDVLFNNMLKINLTTTLNIMLTCAKGLENIVLDELRENFINIDIISVTRGKIIFNINSNIHSLLRLKCADNLYLLISEFECGKDRKSLEKISTKISKLDFSILDKVYDSKNKCKICVKAGREGKHNYSRFDLEKAVLRGILSKRRFMHTDGTEADLEFRFDLNDDKGIISLKLTSPQFRFRQKERSFSAGAIRPTIAHSLIWLSGIDKNDIFYDPCCGSGTILSERDFYPARRIIGSDISDSAITAAKNNNRSGIIIYKDDATNCCMKDKTITKIVSNIPWDQQIKVANVFEFYFRILSQIIRIIHEEGKIVLFTDKEAAINYAAEKCGVYVDKVATLSLHGLYPSIFIIRMGE